MFGETPPYRLVFKNVSYPDNIRYEAVVRNKTGYYFSKSSIEELAEEFNRLAEESVELRGIPIINHPPVDWEFQHIKLSELLKRLGIGELPTLILIPLQDSEFQALA